MAGVYVHIPFCKSRCRYCDFFSTTSLDRRETYTAALLREMDLRRDYLLPERVRTVYFGGGTPSLLDTKDVKRLVRHIRETFETDKDAEVTLEANPGDLTAEMAERLREAGINRLSIGIQSFDDYQLHLIGRRHTAEEARKAVRLAQSAGFENISIDLIYGLPEKQQGIEPLEAWSKEIDEALALDIQHISAYCLTYEEGTPLTEMLQRGEIEATDDDTANAMYDLLTERLKESGYAHYEVSNFALAGRESRHNSGYWDGTPYIGVGAGAHSYNGTSRQWNIDNLEAYIEGIEAGHPYTESETLSMLDRYNERVMLGLRTAKGIDLKQLNEAERTYCLDRARPHLQRGELNAATDRLTATTAGIKILNIITTNLMQ